MLIIRGVNVFPSQIEAVLIAIEGLEPHYQLIVDRVGTLDTLEVQVEVTDSQFINADEVKVLQKLEKQLMKDMKDYLGITAKVKLVEPKPFSARKARPAGSLIKENIITCVINTNLNRNRYGKK